MPEEKKEPEAVRVVDRRRFTTAGELRPEVEETKDTSEPAPPAPPRAGSATGATETAPAESRAAREARQRFEQQRPPFEQKTDFQTLVLSLSTTAMFQLGLVEDPARGRPPADLEAARQTIDLLAVLEEKTRGNLTTQEGQLLEQVLYELRLAFVHVSESGQASKPGGSS